MHCPMCGWPMVVRDHGHQGRRSEDHILPRQRGGKRVLFGDVRNIRIICQDCNGQLQACNHCRGMLACVRDIARQEGVRVGVIMRRWKLGWSVA